jgi:hypothetical protein
MDRNRWMVTTLWFVLVAAGGMAEAVILNGGNVTGGTVVGLLLVLAFVGVKTHRWMQNDREQWRARSRRKPR